jgi:hypothetical protein
LSLLSTAGWLAAVALHNGQARLLGVSSTGNVKEQVYFLIKLLLGLSDFRYSCSLILRKALVTQNDMLQSMKDKFL